jgi:predicted ATP-grasp superfamily ATP-dependent carboligase
VEAPVACVLGSLSVVRALGRARVPVAIVHGEANRHLSLSRYVAHALLPNGTVLDTLERFAITRLEPPVLYFDNDDDLLLVSRHRARLAPCFRFVLPPPTLVEDLVDKNRFAVLAGRLSLPVPETHVVVAGTATRDDGARAWRRFPCIVKPSVRTRWFGERLCGRVIGTQKALEVGSRGELDALLPALEAHGGDFVLQQLIAGGEAHVVSYHAYVRDGVVVADFTGRKVRTTPRAFGMSTCIEITDEAHVRALGRDVLERLGFSGIVKLDFKEDPRTRRLHLLEANPRFNLWHHPGALAGVNLPLLVYRDLVAPGCVRAGEVKARAGVRWMAAGRDWHALREHRAAGALTALGWLRELKRADIIEDLCWNDPLPDAARLLSRWIGRARTAATTPYIARAVVDPRRPLKS